MPCLLALVALFIPRVVIVLIWLFSNWLQTAFDTLLWPILGFIFAPTVLLWYSVVVNVYGGVWSPVPIIGMVIAVLIDISPGWRRRS
jgi:H+/Cl- antiporter ClcA